MAAAAAAQGEGSEEWKSLSRVSLAQAEAVDIETGRKTGMIPDFHAMVEWYQTHLPDESKTGLRVVHGDYKLDNMIFHPTENRVIGILDWELCTLGSPVRMILRGHRIRQMTRRVARGSRQSDAAVGNRPLSAACGPYGNGRLQECRRCPYLS